MEGEFDKYNESNWLSPEQTREVYVIGIQKGAALQRIIDVTSRNAVNVRAMKNAIFKLKVYAFGEEHQATVSSMDQKGSFRFSQTQLKLLRQEQLMLLSENQRLVDELQKIRKMNVSSLRPPETHPVQNQGGVKASKLMKSIDKTLKGENEIHLMRCKLLCLLATVDKVRQRVLYNAFRRLAVSERPSASAQVNLVNPHRYYTLTKKAACLLLEKVLEAKVGAQKASALALLKGYNKLTPPKVANYRGSPKTARDVTLVAVHKGYQSKLPSVRKHLLNS